MYVATLSNEKDGDMFSSALRPLRLGTPVVLTVEHKKFEIKFRKQKRGPLLFMTPDSVYGGKTGYVVLALERYGSCVYIPGVTKVSDLIIGLGLPGVLAKVLHSKLNQVFKSDRSK